MEEMTKKVVAAMALLLLAACGEKTEATKRMDKLVLFVSKHRAHLSMSRFVPEYQDLEDLIGVSHITAEFLGQVLLDYLDILDHFIDKLPTDPGSGRGFWQGAAYSARYKTETALGCGSRTTRTTSGR